MSDENGPPTFRAPSPSLPNETREERIEQISDESEPREKESKTDEMALTFFSPSAKPQITDEYQSHSNKQVESTSLNHNFT